MSPIKLGLIGLSAKGSWASRAHMPYLSDSSLYQVVALQNSSKESAEAAAKAYSLPDAKCYGNVQDFLADPNIEMVAVSVKVPEHRALAEPVINAKKDIFVEWPLGRDLAEAEHLTKLARSHKLNTMVGLQARQDPAIRKAKEMVEAGELGTILGTTMNATGMIFGPTVVREFLYAMPIEHGANLVTIPAGHAIDALCFVLGEFTSVQATLANNRPELELLDDNGKKIDTVKKTAHDYMAVNGLLKRGGVASVVYQGGNSSTGKNFYWEINGTKGSLVLEGPVGHVQMFHPSLKFVSVENGAKLEDVAVEDTKGFAYNVGSAYEAFAGTGSGNLTTFEDAVIRHRLIDAIYKSNENGMRETYKDVY